jgi:phage portal protein BeeE
MCNLPSEFVNPRQTGKFYDQVSIEGIIEKYALIDRTPIIEFDTNRIIHFNDINTSGVGNSIMGTSRLEVLRYPITNTQLAFEAMNVILKNRGMNGILAPKKLDGMGASMALTTDEDKAVRKEFRNQYGLKDDQDQYMLSPVSLDFYKTSLNSSELGIYKEFSNNAMIISNGFGIPPELYKTYMEGATFENQVQSERRLYQNTVIPLVENEDQYYTERLNMRNYGFELKTDFSHISCLQEGRKENATSLSLNSRSAELAYNNNAITLNEYRALIELEPIPEGNVYKSDRVVNTPVNQNITR